MTFIHDDFLLQTPAARKLYHEFASQEPICDFHCHLPPAHIAGDRQFKNLYEIWLEGDHYKWRAMRLHGVPEAYCTGSADPKEKFLQYARTVPYTLRNPLYHWTHLELKRYFGIDTLLSEETAEAIWEQANDQLQSADLTARGILEKFNVRMVGTTDDPTDDLQHHQSIHESGLSTKVLPTFRPDKALILDNRQQWNGYIDRLAEVCGREIQDLDDLKACLLQRIDFFDAAGCRASDHGLLRCPARIANDADAGRIFSKLRESEDPLSLPDEGLSGNLLAFLGEAYHGKNWVMQLHLGAARNMNGAIFEQLGPDMGCDSIADVQQIQNLGLLLGELSLRGKLPRSVLYNLNPADNYAFATMCGNFFEEGIPHKVQFGSGWWFLDQWEGMTLQLNALSNLGLLSHFIGMLTDSRSFMSFPRHEYFRRLLCDLLGGDLERGAIPCELVPQLGEMVRNISYRNALGHFQLQEA
jgi:glucuronate isomerase